LLGDFFSNFYLLKKQSDLLTMNCMHLLSKYQIN